MSELKPLAEEREATREILARRLPWSPLAYIPGINTAGDRQLFAEELTRAMSAENDLRFIHELPSGGRTAVIAQLLPWDSEFFGYGVARLDGIFPLDEPFNQQTIDVGRPLELLIDQARQRGIKYLFAPVDPRDLSLLRALGDQRFTLLETRIHYHFNVQIVHYVRLPDHAPDVWTRFREATENDIPFLAQVARDSVNPYDRFHGDPWFASEDVDRLMTRWVEESVRGNFADLTVVPDVDEPKAFITYRFHKDKWDRWGMHLVQPVLSAVAPEYLGWFAVVGPLLNQHLREIGAQYAFGKTQITLGLDATVHFGKGEHIFRRVL